MEQIVNYNFFLSFLKACSLDKLSRENEANEAFVRTMLLAPSNKIREEIKRRYAKKYFEIETVDKFITKINTHKIRILHGTMEIANQMYTYTSGLKRLGAYARTLNYYNSYLNYKTDWNIPFHKISNDFIRKIIDQFEIFHFHFGTSLIPNKSDLPILKKLGKVLLMQYWGSDVRRKSIAEKFNPYAKVKVNEEVIKKDLELVSQYIEHAITDFVLFEYIVDYHKHLHYIPQAINLGNYQYKIKEPNEKLIIVHAPTSPEFKGTDYIIKSVNKLKKKYQIEFILVQGKSHDEAKKIYQNADIVVDQLHSEGYGLFAIESMAMGKPVVTSIPDYYLKKYPERPPVIRANPDNIEEVLEKLISNPRILPELGKKGREYVEKHHDIEKIKYDLLQLYYELSKEVKLL